jgi:uncharacterized protein
MNRSASILRIKRLWIKRFLTMDRIKGYRDFWFESLASNSMRHRLHKRYDAGKFCASEVTFLILEACVLASLLLLVALLYSSVGHGGASGYLAAMALVGVSPFIMKPTALALNIAVASIASWKFYRTGSYSWKLFIPLAITAVPMAFLGGTLTLPPNWYKPLIGLILVYAAWYSISTAKQSNDYPIRSLSPGLLAVIGAALGLLSGITGVGGGIFLSPLLLFLRLAPVKVISGVAAMFILVNSIAGVLGVMQTSHSFHPALGLWILVVLIGGWIGAEYGSKRLANPVIQRLLSLVLLIAGLKMLASV